MRMASRIRFFVGSLLPGGYTTGLKGWLLKFFGEVVSFAAFSLQGISPLWNDDPDFRDVYQKLVNRIDMDQRRAHILYSFARKCSNIPGKYAEVGAFRGGSAMLISRASKNTKEIYVFDTFEGFPETTQGQDLAVWKKGEMHDVNLEEVKRFFDGRSVRFFKGIFPHTTDQIPESDEFAFVHLDTDLYESTLEGCRYFYSRLSRSGVILIDDYGMVLFPGVKTAVDSFESEIPETGIYLPTGQYLIIKE